MDTDFTPGEQKAHDAILDAMSAIREIDEDKLKYNSEELSEAIHVLQHFVTQHWSHRIHPGFYSNWYGD